MRVFRRAARRGVLRARRSSVPAGPANAPPSDARTTGDTVRDRWRRNRESTGSLFVCSSRPAFVIDYVLYSALIFTYSADRSHVQTADVLSPTPRSTPTATSLPFRYAAASGARSSYGLPSANNTVGPIVTFARLGSHATPARPATASSRPQLGSPPWIAVFTSSDVAIAFAVVRASRTDAAPETVTFTSFVAPSPPRTMPSASS